MAAHPTRVLPPHFVAVLVAAWLTAPVLAQRIALGSRGVDPPSASVVDETVVVDLTTGASVFRSPRFAGGDRSSTRGAVFSATGRHLLFESTTAGVTSLVLVDLEARVETVLPWTFSPLATHPRDTAFFGDSGGTPARLDLAGLHLWPVCGSDPVVAMDPSSSGAQVAILCGARVVVVDGSTGLPAGTFPTASGATHVRLLGADGVIVASPTGLQRHDATSGAVLAARPDLHAVAAAGPRQQALAWTCSVSPLPRPITACRVAIIDGVSLADVRALPSDGLADRAALTDDVTQLFTHGIAAVSEARWTEVASGATRARLARALTLYSLGVGSVPLPPVLAAPVVSAGTVTLAWAVPDHSTLPTEYVVSAGAGSGASDVLFRLGPNATFSASGVPPGRYYVRVRAANSNGISPPSNEIVVDVS